MKKTILLTWIVLLGLAAQASKIKAKSPVHIVSTRMGVFYFKIDKEFMGAELEVYSQDGIKLFSQKVEHRKVLVDFYYENAGRYVIIVKKADYQEEFSFIKDSPCLEAERPAQTITVAQGI